jgi:hypothetical protein
MRFVLRELLRPSRRVVIYGCGALIASALLVVLFGAVRTQHARVGDVVSSNFRTTYDILVRPRGARGQLEQQDGLVRDNFETDIYGGISFRQYQQIKDMSGVAVAAPIAVVGYVFQDVSVPIDLTAETQKGRRQLFTFDVKRVTDHGLVHLDDELRGYVYVTPNPIVLPTTHATTGMEETLPTGQTVTVCPFDLRGALDRTSADCWSEQTGAYGGGWSASPLPKGHVGVTIRWPIPFRISAVDPAAEAALVGLRGAMVSGRYLTQRDVPRVEYLGGTKNLEIPVISADRSYLDDVDKVVVRSTSPSVANEMIRQPSVKELNQIVNDAAGPVVKQATISAPQAFRLLIQHLLAGHSSAVDAFWTTGPTQYRQVGPRDVAPRPVQNSSQIWRSHLTKVQPQSADQRLRNYRQIDQHHAVSRRGPLRFLHAVGSFDPTKLEGFSALSRVPLATYEPPQAAPADARTDRLLGGADLEPNTNIGGYLQAPPLLLTTIEGLRGLVNAHAFTGTDVAAPISSIRVRVAGVNGDDAVSREKIADVAKRIAETTGLSVDVTAGSSPAPVTVHLAGGQGEPSLSVVEQWAKVGAAVAVLTAFDRKTLLLLIGIGSVYAIFGVGAGAALVSQRRRQYEVVRAFGWSFKAVAAWIMAELLVVNLVCVTAGGLGAVLIDAEFGGHVSWLTAVVGLLASCLLAFVVSLPSAVRGARAEARHRRPVSTPIRPATVVRLGLANTLRRPSRTLLAVAAVYLASLVGTAVAGITVSESGRISGTSLGRAIASDVFRSDYLALLGIMLLAAVAVGQLYVMNTEERKHELEMLVTFGWRRGALVKMAGAEALAATAIGAVAGAACGTLVANELAGAAGAVLLVTAPSVAAGMVVLSTGALWVVTRDLGVVG